MFKRLFSIVSKCILSVKGLVASRNFQQSIVKLRNFVDISTSTVHSILPSCHKYQVLLLPSPRGYELIQIFNTTRICRPYSTPQVVYVWKAPDIGFCPPFYWGNKQYKQTNSVHRMYWHHHSATFYTSTSRTSDFSAQFLLFAKNY